MMVETKRRYAHTLWMYKERTRNFYKCVCVCVRARAYEGIEMYTDISHIEKRKRIPTTSTCTSFEHTKKDRQRQEGRGRGRDVLLFTV